MPSYKLTYFGVRGRSMHIRYLCIDNNVELEVETIAATIWPTFKPTTELGQLPMLTNGTLRLAQSNAILRYLARKNGLYGKNDEEAAVIDMLNDEQDDLRNNYLRLIYHEYESGKDDFVKAIPATLAPFERFLGKNHAGSGFLVGDHISFVDYTVFDLLDLYLVLSPECLDTLPLLKAYYGRIADREKIAAFRNSDEFKNMPINANGKQ